MKLLAFLFIIAARPDFSVSLQTNPCVTVAVIVPGFLTGSEDFQPLADSLTKRGIPTVTVPMPSWHWIPCIGGRSVRPILERIDHTVKHVSACLSEGEGESQINVPPFKYTFLDCYRDFLDNPGGVGQVGGSSTVDEYPEDVSPQGEFPPPTTDPKVRIALIGHSAGGFISRAYLSDRKYGGKAYKGTELVHSLVTLGTPHKDAPGPAFESVKWCNQEPLSIRGMAIGATGTPGDSSGSLTQGAYAFCSGESDGSDLDGDGLTTIESALALVGDRVEQKILDGVTHYPWSDAGIWGALFTPDLAKEHRSGKPWYGDDKVVDEWVDFLLEEPESDKSPNLWEKIAGNF